MILRSATLLAKLLLAVSTLAFAQDKTRGMGTRPPTPAPIGAGSYYALVIGIDTYPASMPQLKTARSDANTLAQVLEQKYGFHVQRLLDDQATRKGILSAITGYRNVLTSADNLLIYYAGHGALDEGVAYWLPSGSEAADPSNWVSADDVNHGIRALSAAHILVVSDSCFSGGLAQPGQRFVAPAKPTVEQAAYLEKMGQRRSRTLMASGGNEPVADSGTEGHSVFAFPLIEGLEHPDQLTFTAQHLFEQSIRIRVGGNASQTPLYTPLANSGHDGGDFIFTRTNLTADEIAAVAPHNTAGPSPAEVKSTELYNRGVLMAGTSRYSEAVPLLTSACDGGSATACAYLGFMYANATGVPKDDAREATLYRKACDGGEAIGCTRLGFMYGTGNGLAKDDAQAVTLYRKGCDGGDARGCTDLGVMYRAGTGVAKDYAQAVALFRKGCDGGDGDVCNDLGVMYEKGNLVAKDAVLAVTLYRKACDDGDFHGCTNLAGMYGTGNGVTKDSGQAASLYRQACAGGDARACGYQGLMFENGYGVPKDAVQALALYRKACDGGFDGGCLHLGINFEKGIGTGPNQSEAVKSYKKGCDLKDSDSCDALKRLHPQ